MSKSPGSVEVWIHLNGFQARRVAQPEKSEEEWEQETKTEIHKKTF